MEKNDYQAMMDKARAKMKEFDEIDGGQLWRTPILGHLQTAMSAVEAGINCGDWGCVAEGQAMLEGLYQRINNAPDRDFERWARAKE